MIRLVVCLGLCLYCLSACENTANRKIPLSKPDTPKHQPSNLDLPATQYTSKLVYTDPLIKFDTAGGNRYIVLDTLKFKIPAGEEITPKNLYNGIYELGSGLLTRRGFLITKDLVFMTTYDDVGFGYRADLYVFSRTSKRLIRDKEFDRDYLYSPVGVFVIDPRSNRIFSEGKYELYEAIGEGITGASLYTVKGGYFKNIKNVYKVGEEDPDDLKSLLSFYKITISTNSNRVHILPPDWWKSK